MTTIWDIPRRSITDVPLHEAQARVMRMRNNRRESAKRKAVERAAKARPALSSRLEVTHSNADIAALIGILENMVEPKVEAGEKE